jgi:mannonate dehydratase
VVFEAARQRFGDALHLLHDSHHQLTPTEVAQLGRALEPYRLFWLEDPTPTKSQDAWTWIRVMTTTPLAVGGVLNALWDSDALISRGLIDYIRTTIVHGGGITHVRRIADFAAHYHVRTGFHGAQDNSPVTMGAAFHFGRWVPNFGIQEYQQHPARARGRLQIGTGLSATAICTQAKHRGTASRSTRKQPPAIPTCVTIST